MRFTALLLLAVLPLPAADRGFNDVVEAISNRCHTRPTRIPLFGLVNAFTFVARPAGTSHIDLAVFENLNGHLDPAEIRQLVGAAWKPFVQSYSRKNRETTLIFLRTEGRDIRMLITNLERDEATVVELKLNPEGLRRWMDDPAHQHNGILNHGDH